MKILIIDDNSNHRAAAEAQLKDHDVTVVGTYDDGQELLKKEHDFEVVLVDLLMPASKQSLGRNLHLAGEEMPVGIFLAILAAKNGAKYVGVLTDMDHHSHPASACFDAFSKMESYPQSFKIEDATVVLSNNRNWVKHFYKDDLSKEMPFKEWYDKEDAGDVEAKDWRSFFDYLLGNPVD